MPLLCCLLCIQKHGRSCKIFHENKPLSGCFLSVFYHESRNIFWQILAKKCISSKCFKKFLFIGAILCARKYRFLLQTHIIANYVKFLQKNKPLSGCFHFVVNYESKNMFNHVKYLQENKPLSRCFHSVVYYESKNIFSQIFAKESTLSRCFKLFL